MIALGLLLYHGFATALGFNSIVENFDALMFTFILEVIAEGWIGFSIALIRSYINEC